jgi:hypothetical protein
LDLSEFQNNSDVITKAYYCICTFDGDLPAIVAGFIIYKIADSGHYSGMYKI